VIRGSGPGFYRKLGLTKAAFYVKLRAGGWGAEPGDAPTETKTSQSSGSPVLQYYADGRLAQRTERKSGTRGVDKRSEPCYTGVQANKTRHSHKGKGTCAACYEKAKGR